MKGRLESIIRITSTTTVASVTDSGGTDAAIAVAAEDYYLSSDGTGPRSFLAELANALNTSGTLAGTYTVTMANGRITIACDETFTVTWASTIIRDLLGYDDDLASAASHQAERRSQAAWVPDGHFQSLNCGEWRGYWEAEKYDLESPSGEVYAVMGERKRAIDLRWPAIEKSHIWACEEVVGNESFERFCANCIWGDKSWSQVAGPLRWYPVDGDDENYGTYRVPGLGAWRPEQARANYTGQYSLDIPRMVQVRSEATIALLPGAAAPEPEPDPGSEGSWPRTAVQVKTATGYSSDPVGYWLFEAASGDEIDLIGSADAAYSGTFAARAEDDVALNTKVARFAGGESGSVVNAGNVHNITGTAQADSFAFVWIGKLPADPSPARRLYENLKATGSGRWRVETVSGGRLSFNFTQDDGTIRTSNLPTDALGATPTVIGVIAKGNYTTGKIQLLSTLGNGATPDLTGACSGQVGLAIFGGINARPESEAAAFLVYRGAAAEGLLVSHISALMTYAGVTS